MDSYKAIQRVCFFSAFALIGHNCGLYAARRVGEGVRASRVSRNIV